MMRAAVRKETDVHGTRIGDPPLIEILRNDAQDFGRRLPRAKDARSRLLNASS
jgi:hypothetical protein